MFSGELRVAAEALVGRYPVGRSALLPLLHLVQHADGYLSEDGIAECAHLLGLTKAEVMAVATFYTMYKRRPLGRHLVSVCTNFSCHVRGAGEVYERLVKKLGVGHEETTADGTFTLEHAECLGNCEGAPVVTIDYLNYECVSPDAAEELLDRVAARDIPPPTRGFTPPGVRVIEHRLAGLGATDGTPGTGAGSGEQAAGPRAGGAPARADSGPDASTASSPGSAAPAAGPQPGSAATPAEFQGTGGGSAEPGEAPEELGAKSGTGGGDEYQPNDEAVDPRAQDGPHGEGERDA